MGSIIDLNYSEFGRLTVFAQAQHRGKTIYWCCICQCGNKIEVDSRRLREGKTRSCGCLQKEWAKKKQLQNHYKHGEAKENTPEYRAWLAMKIRCDYPKTNGYENYGGRGITICQEWRDNYKSFLNDVGRKPSPKHSLDRIDVNGNYEPGNVKWSTMSEQCLNKRSHLGIPGAQIAFKPKSHR